MKNSNINFNGNFKDFLEKSEAYNYLLNDIEKYRYVDKVAEEFKDIFEKLIKLSVEELMLNWENKSSPIFINNSPIQNIERKNSKELKEYFKDNHPTYVHLLGRHVKSLVNYLLNTHNVEEGLSLANSLEYEARDHSNQPKKKAYRAF